MTIEWVPRSRRSENDWREPVASGYALDAEPAQVDGVWGVRVPVREQRFRWRTLLTHPWLVVIGAITWLIVHDLGTGRATAEWSWWIALTGWLAAAVLLYGALRLQPIRAGHQRDLVLSPVGVHTGGLLVPWAEVQQVVRFSFIFGPGRGGPGARNFLALRVRDFVGVRGLTPAQAGLANLTRRHLVVLAEARELRDPKALARAIEQLVADPESRSLLAGPAGVRLVAEGPKRPPSG